MPMSGEGQPEADQVAAGALRCFEPGDGAVLRDLEGRHEDSLFRHAAEERRGPGAHGALRLWRLRGLRDARLLRPISACCGCRMAASMSSPTSAAAASSGRPGTRRRCKRTARTPMTISRRWPQDLIRRGITTPKQLGIMGGSNGGLLVSAMMVAAARSLRRRRLPGAAGRHDPLHPDRRRRVLGGGIWRSRRSRRRAPGS